MTIIYSPSQNECHGLFAITGSQKRNRTDQNVLLLRDPHPGGGVRDVCGHG